MSSVAANCRRPSCPNAIPDGLVAENLCLDHFLDEALVRTDNALDSWRRGMPLSAQDVEWLLSDALAVVSNLEAGADDPNPDQRDRMLELLLNISNLHELAAQNSVVMRRIS